MNTSNSKHELSAYERWIYYMTLLGDENVIGVSILETIGDNEQLPDINNGLFKDALKYMAKRHPLLRAFIKQEKNDKIFYEILDNIDNQLEYKYQVVESRNELINSMELFNMKLFDYSRKCLLWRVKLVKFKDNDNREKYCIILILPMYMTDGVNITTLLVELVNIVNSLLTRQTCIEMSESLDLLDNIHSLLNEQNFKIDLDAINELKRKDLHVNFNLPYKFKDLYDEGLKININKLNKEQTKCLVNKCKSNGQKLTGALIQCAYRAFGKLYQENGFQMQKDFSIFVPANMRFRTQPNIPFSSIRICVLLTKLNLLYPQLSMDNNWNSIKYINECLAKETNITTGSLFKFSHDFDSLKAVDELFKGNDDLTQIASILNQENSCDFVLSNTGTYVYDSVKRISGPLIISETYYGDSLVSIPNEFAPIMLHTSTWNDCLMIQLSSNRRIFSSENADKFVKYFIDEILKLN